MGLKCWNGATCTRDCIKPCRPQMTLDQAETIREMAPTNQFFDDGDPRRALKAPEPPVLDWRRLLKNYMLTILREEGVTYVQNSGVHLAGDLTAHERAAILEISNEVKKENPDAYLG